MNKTILLLLYTQLVLGCAQTRIYDRGQLAAVIQGDAWNVNIRTDHSYFHADVLNHSESTKAMSSVVAPTVGALGTAALVFK